MLKGLFSIVLLFSLVTGISSTVNKFINENDLDTEVDAGGSGQQFMRYVKLIRNCVKSQTVFPPALVKAGESCMTDSRAAEDFDCFTSCMTQQFGALYERRVGEKMYLASEFNKLIPILDESYGSRSVSETILSIITRCQVFMPDSPFFPVMENCNRLNGIFTCTFMNVLKRYNCQMDAHQRELLALFDLDDLYKNNNCTIST